MPKRGKSAATGFTLGAAKGNDDHALGKELKGVREQDVEEDDITLPC
jgi:hypothetical protein